MAASYEPIHRRLQCHLAFAVYRSPVREHCSNVHAQQPYAGLEKRTIKALADQQISDLRAGRGMGMALPAELNGYPGPWHVIELAEKLTLSEPQLATAKIFLRP